MTECRTDLIPDRKYAPQNLGRVLILGLGQTGHSALSYILPLVGTRVESVSVAAFGLDDAAKAYMGELASKGVRVAQEGCVPEGAYDLCIASPGISNLSDFFRAARDCSAEIVSEVEFAWRESRLDSRWVAITGTNGKTTVTSLCAHVLAHAGMDTLAVGNIGVSCLEAVAKDAACVYVCECSSYQLASTSRFAPDVAIMLNITPDHIAWHGSFEAYVEAKCRVFAHIGQQGGIAVIDAVCDTTREQVRAMRAAPEDQRVDYVPMGARAGYDADMRQVCGAENAAFIRSDGMLVVAFGDEEHQIINRADLVLPGLHNAGNALFACVAALRLGASDEAICNALKSFAPLEHRIEPCGTVDGVACYNDSKATNVDATLTAIGAFEDGRAIVLLGGDDKGTDLSELVAAVEAGCKAAVCYGASKDRFVQAFRSSSAHVIEADHMADAFDAALGVADAGDVILLSPACASFDEFKNFEVRGDEFKKLVAQHCSR